MTTRRHLLTAGAALATVTAIPGMAGASVKTDDLSVRVAEALMHGARTGGTAFHDDGLSPDVAEFLLNEKLAYSIGIKRYRNEFNYIDDPDHKVFVVTGLNEAGMRMGHILLARQLAPEAGTFLDHAFKQPHDLSQVLARSVAREDVERRLYNHLIGPAADGRLPYAPLVLGENSHRKAWIIAGLEQGSLRPGKWSSRDEAYTLGGVLWVERTPQLLIGSHHSWRGEPAAMTWEIDKIALANDVRDFKSLPVEQRAIFSQLVLAAGYGV